MIYDMKLHEEPFVLMLEGKKTIELRLNDEKRKLLRVGDVIRFTRIDDSQAYFCALIIKIYHSENFEELYKRIPLLKCGYTEDNILNASALDMDKYYSKEEQEKNDVIGIEVQVLKDKNVKDNMLK